MFSKIHNLISERKYDDAISALSVLYQENDPKVSAYAGYLLGYIHSRYDYTQRNRMHARKYLRENMLGDYSHPYAFVLYARIEDDNNVALNYLHSGLSQFPNDERILEELLRLSNDKPSIIALIKDSGLCNPNLMGKVITCLFKEKQWDQIGRFLFRIEQSCELEENEQQALNLIKGYIYLFQDNPDYIAAQNLFKEIIQKDLDNKLAYSHYLGLIFSCLQQGVIEEAVWYFDCLPVNNSIIDFDTFPWYFEISLNFESEYKIIFEKIIETFSRDSHRKIKAQVLRALYLYQPSEAFDIYRYRKTDMSVLSRYLKEKFDPILAAALFNMQCHFKQFLEAYQVLWDFLKADNSPIDYWISVDDIFEQSDEAIVDELAKETIRYLQEPTFARQIYLNELLPSLIGKLHERKLYARVRSVAEFASNKEIAESKCAFEVAYAFGEIEDKRAAEIYKLLIVREPQNASAYNNLGVFYRRQNQLYEALLCFEKAQYIDPKKELYQINLKKTQEDIQNELADELILIADNFCVESLQKIGYDTELCKALLLIDDTILQGIMQRDLRECAIAIVAGQDKLAAVMCGSIVESLLLYKLREAGVESYDVTTINPRKKGAVSVSNMALNELLYVAYEKDILDNATYHLGHYLRDYRNIIHPAKEIRMQNPILHEDATTMWSVLVKVIHNVLS